MVSYLFLEKEAGKSGQFLAVGGVKQYKITILKVWGAFFFPLSLSRK